MGWIIIWHNWVFFWFYNDISYLFDPPNDTWCIQRYWWGNRSFSSLLISILDSVMSVSWFLLQKLTDKFSDWVRGIKTEIWNHIRLHFLRTFHNKTSYYHKNVGFLDYKWRETSNLCLRITTHHLLLDSFVAWRKSR